MLDQQKNEKSTSKTEKMIKLVWGNSVPQTGEFLEFRIQGLQPSEVEQVEEGRVPQLVDKIETHPHKEKFQADLPQDNVCNPFSENSKKMDHEVGNIEYFELGETDSRVQCSYCLSYWTQANCDNFFVAYEFLINNHPFSTVF